MLLLLLPYQAALLHLYQGVLGPYWAERRKLVEVGYRDIEPGVQHFGLVVRRELETQQEQSVESLVSTESCRAGRELESWLLDVPATSTNLAF
jgi:hypothetical protein